MDKDQGRIEANIETGAETQPETERLSSTLCSRQAITRCSREDEWTELPRVCARSQINHEPLLEREPPQVHLYPTLSEMNVPSYSLPCQWGGTMFGIILSILLPRNLDQPYKVQKIGS